MQFFRDHLRDNTDVRLVETRLTADMEQSAYNLAGQRVGKDYRGIVVVNGRKNVLR